MAVDKNLIVKLREATNAGFLDCKKALEASNNDFEASVKWLREKGIAKAEKNTNRETHEGVVLACEHENRAQIIEINCETDFVARNEKFSNLVNKIMQLALSKKLNTVEDILNASIDNESVKSYMLAISSTLGEKLHLSYSTHLEKNDNESFGIYNHMNNKISCVTIVNAQNKEDIARNIAMHVSAMNPAYISSKDISANVIEQEKSVLIQQALEENNKAVKKVDEKIVNQRVMGRLNKLMAEKCLVDQSYVKEPSVKIKEYLKNNNCEVIKFVRREVGK